MVVRRDWKALPMPQSVINWLNAKAKGRPFHPVFTDRLGNAIGDIPFDVGRTEMVEPDVDLPGVHIPEVGEHDEIPGVDPAQELELPEPYVNVGVDFNNPAPQELPLVKLEPVEPIQEPLQSNDGVCRST